jgi:hypothetical protein
MGWFCQTEEAKAQLKKCYANDCPGCNKCIWIEESANAMAEYGKVIEPESKPEIEEPYNEYSQTHTVFRDDYTPEETKPTKTFDSFEEKVEYIIDKFGGKKID